MASDSTAQHFLSQFQTPVNIAPSAPLSSSPTSDRRPSNDMTASTASAAADDKAKRLTACLVCRKRKLKCDSARPKCASCARLGHAWYIPSLDNVLIWLVATRKPERSLAPNKDMSRNSNKSHKLLSRDLLNWKNCLQLIRRSSRLLRQSTPIFRRLLEYLPSHMRTFLPLDPPRQTP